MKQISFIFLLSAILISSCKNNSKYNVDISDINVEIKVMRFEKDLFKFNLDSADFYVNEYEQKYGEFFKLYNSQVIGTGDSEDEYYAQNLNEFLRYWKPKEINIIIENEFSDFEKDQLPVIEETFKYYKYYFPENHVPELITYFSSFGYSVVMLDSTVGLGLDKYLGLHNSDVYDKVGYSRYQKRRMIKEMIPVDIMRLMAESDYPYDPEESDNFLDNIIYEGKMQYYLNCMLPKTADTLKWRYTKKQLAWATKHEQKIWNYIAERKLLFSTDKLEIRKFTGEGPYTSVFTDISAPRAGAFIGYKIVESYMKHNFQTGLKELLEEKDARKILSGAKYSP
ncbi:MAG: hypothetical protein L3J35_01615 [Bacteroidales bacterium]|nr:hypothetical protein [Bacteroidales bacterium]